MTNHGAAGLTYRPVVSIITPVYNTEPAILQSTVESVIAQTYPRWELCLVDDGSTRPDTLKVLGRLASRDPRMKLLRRDSNGGISAASNDALEMASGEFVVLLDHDDELTEDAVEAVVSLLNTHPEADFIYSDEDRVERDGSVLPPFRKPTWSPEYLRSCPYTCHLSAFRTSVVRDVGGFRSDYDGAQDYDLTLRVVELTDRIHHIARVLYHWRMVVGSTATALENKPYAIDAGRRALADSLRRQGIGGVVEDAQVPGWFRVRYDIVGDPLVSIIIPTAGRSRSVRGEQRDLVTQCVRSVIRATTYEHYEVLVVIDDATPTPVLDDLRDMGDERIRFIGYQQAFNFSRKINVGAAHARGDHLLMLNDDVEVISPEWLTAMLEFSQRPEIGAVGGKLYFPDGSIQHAGVVVSAGLPAHVYYGEPSTQGGYYGNLVLNYNYSAVTGACLMTRADVFRDVGGLSLRFPLNYNDIDYCLKLRMRGYRIVFTPYAELFHFESSTRSGVVQWHELQRLQSFWGERMRIDPYYNPNFAQKRRDYT